MRDSVCPIPCSDALFKRASSRTFELLPTLLLLRAESRWPSLFPAKLSAHIRTVVDFARREIFLARDTMHSRAAQVVTGLVAFGCLALSVATSPPSCTAPSKPRCLCPLIFDPIQCCIDGELCTARNSCKFLANPTPNLRGPKISLRAAKSATVAVHAKLL